MSMSAAVAVRQAFKQHLMLDAGASADAPADATYGNFTSDRIFRSPTDLNWIIGRVLVLNDNDTAKAYSYSGNITLSPYNTAGESLLSEQPCTYLYSVFTSTHTNV